MKKSNYELFNNVGLGGYELEDYQEFCNDNQIKFNEDNFYNWVSKQLDFDLECLFDNLKYADKSIRDKSVVIEGTLGLWWGSPTIDAKMCDNIIDAIQLCINGNQCRINKNGNKIIIESVHHDGTNIFELTILSDLGRERFLRNGKVSTTNYANFVKLPMYLF